jgi:hypothetical protein
VSIRLQQELEETTVRWSEWALEQTASWKAGDDPGRWDPDSVYTPLAETWSRGPLT